MYEEKANAEFTEKEFEDWNERAAILQFDGGYSKEESEKKAFFMILRERKDE